MRGLLDAIDALPAEVPKILLDLTTEWPDKGVRQAAAELIAGSFQPVLQVVEVLSGRPSTRGVRSRPSTVGGQCLISGQSRRAQHRDTGRRRPDRDVSTSTDTPRRGTMVAMSIGEELLEERRRRRRAGDPRITPEGRVLLLRMTAGDLMDEFQAALDADLESDPLLGGSDTGHDT